MSRTTRHTRRILIALVLAATAAAALPALAAGALVTVRVEGQSATLLLPTTVAIGDGRSDARTFDGRAMPSRCPNNTAYQAVELALRGEWDRRLFAETVRGEAHRFSPNEEYWITYDKDVTSAEWHYDEWGLCELVLVEGSTILLQAGRSGLEELFIPHSVPLELERVSPRTGAITVRGSLRVHVTKWRPHDIFGTENRRGHFVVPLSRPTDGAGYTVTAGSAEARTNERGEATIRLDRAGRFTLRASMPGSALDWSRTLLQDICVEDGTEIC